LVDNDVDERSGPAILYDVIRNPFAHSLGIETSVLGGERRNKRVVRRHRKKEFGIGVSRIETEAGHGLTSEVLAELEGASRPKWLGPTLDRHDSGVTLSVEALYRAVRDTIEAMTCDKSAMEHARKFLKEVR
jgi:hypothetical protein